MGRWEQGKQRKAGAVATGINGLAHSPPPPRPALAESGRLYRHGAEERGGGGGIEIFMLNQNYLASGVGEGLGGGDPLRQSSLGSIATSFDNHSISRELVNEQGREKEGRKGGRE